jgi:GT2 family glycosyltransferase
MQSPRTTIIVTQRERFSLYQSSLASLYETNEPFDLIYVDMASPQAIKNQIERDADERGFRVIRLDQIVSQNAARNIALEYTHTELVAFVDNDVFMSNGWLEELIDCADATGAALVGPITMEGTAESGIVHFIAGDAHIDHTERGNYFVRSHPFVRGHISAVNALSLGRQKTEALEFHCLLVRRSLFDRVGYLDEGLATFADHDDLCMMAGRIGEQVYAETATVARYDNSVPLLWCDVFYFLLRWCANSARKTMKQFADKHQLAADDPYRKSMFKWVMKHHKELPFPPMGGPLITAVVRTALEVVTDISSYFPPKPVNITLYLQPKHANQAVPAQAVR